MNIDYQAWRRIKESLATYSITAGALLVLLLLALIGAYLFYQAWPLFKSVKVAQVATYPVSAVAGEVASESPLYLALEEYRTLAFRIDAAGTADFFDAQSGKIKTRYKLLDAIKPKAPPTASQQADQRKNSAQKQRATASEIAVLPPTITAIAASKTTQGLVVLGLGDGRGIVVQQTYAATYLTGTRVTKPELTFPLGKAPIVLDRAGEAIVKAALAQEDGVIGIAALTRDGRILLHQYSRQDSFLTEGDESWSKVSREVIGVQNSVARMLLDSEQQRLLVADAAGFVHVFDVGEQDAPIRLIDQVRAVPHGVAITALVFLSGEFSWLLGDSSGAITQWFSVRDASNNKAFKPIREFGTGHDAILQIAVEPRRKSFVALDTAGRVVLYHATTHRVLKNISLRDEIPLKIALSARGDGLLLETKQGTTHLLDVVNPHPEISWQSLWGKVWYEGQSAPEHIWQSSSTSDGGEPKLSLTPLTFGSLKAAGYSMLFAIPLAILGAMYTACFMSAPVRRWVKPTIEIMAALPSVVLGFVAAVWFAPLIEKNLMGIFLMVILLPPGVIMACLSWRFIEKKWHYSALNGAEALLLLPVVAAFVMASFWLAHPLEQLFFGSDFTHWIARTGGFSYETRNSMIVGVAMGFAVIPVIFSISEDAIYGVPRHLSTSSLALGATQWQTVTRVVVLAASPGMFSAVMIGMGRAVGETMIVVMATGNTAIINFNPFQGLRALSANIAVEMPEAAVGSTHFRVLFLSGLVLFVITFLLNTLAEAISHRLRKRYSPV